MATGGFDNSTNSKFGDRFDTGHSVQDGEAHRNALELLDALLGYGRRLEIIVNPNIR